MASDRRMLHSPRRAGKTTAALQAALARLAAAEAVVEAARDMSRDSSIGRAFANLDAALAAYDKARGTR